MIDQNKKSTNARRVLDAFRHFNTRAGEMLLEKNFVAYGANRGWQPSEIAADIDAAYDLGWVDGGRPGQVVLTAEGFGEINT